MKKVIIIVILIIFILLAIFGIVTPIVTFKDVNVYVNESLKSNDFVGKVSLGKIVSEKVDTSKLGKLEVEIKIKSFLGITKKYKREYQVIDNIEPSIEAKSEIVVYQGDNIDLLKDAKVQDNYDKDVKLTLEGDYDINKVGEYNLKYIAKDSSGNETSCDLKLKVIAKPVPKPNAPEASKTSKGYAIENRNGVTYVNGILIVNKTYALPKNYGNGLTKETEVAFYKMQTAAKNEGLTLKIVSGFRSYQDQVIVYNDWVNKDGKSVADTYSARAGHSEHQTGLAMDLNWISNRFEDTNEYRWLQANAYKYGFIMRYLKNKQDVTGYIYEPWHYRYVGVELAKELYNNGNWITLEDYLGIDSKYK